MRILYTIIRYLNGTVRVATIIPVLLMMLCILIIRIPNNCTEVCVRKLRKYADPEKEHARWSKEAPKWLKKVDKGLEAITDKAMY